MGPEPNSQTSAHLLFQSAEALLSCAESVTRIEALIGPMIDRGVAGLDRAVLQEVDLLGQSLVDISTCLSRLALAHMRAEPVDADAILAPLRLNDLRSRLVGDGPEKRDLQDRVALF